AADRRRSDLHRSTAAVRQTRRRRGSAARPQGALMADIIEVRDVHKRFGPFKALNGVDLTVAEGEVLVVIGRSGSGKSTLIRCLNQLEAHDSGTILIDGLDASRPRDIRKIRT